MGLGLGDFPVEGPSLRLRLVVQPTGGFIPSYQEAGAQLALKADSEPSTSLEAEKGVVCISDGWEREKEEGQHPAWQPGRSLTGYGRSSRRLCLCKAIIRPRGVGTCQVPGPE